MTNEEALTLLQDRTGFKYSEEQLKILNSTTGIRILACAGSGKTTTLVHLIAKKILTGEIVNTMQVLCTTYSKDGALEMGERLSTLLAKLNIYDVVKVTTIHAFYYSLLRRFQHGYNVCTDRLNYIKRAVKELKLKLKEDDIGLVDSLMSYQVNNMLTSEEMYSSSQFTLNISLEEYRNINKLYIKYKRERNEIDFDDMQLLVYKYLCFPESRNQAMYKYCRENFKYFFIDEFQDVSKLQYAIFKAIIGTDENMVIIGDDDQSIYSWRGADPTIITNVNVDYNLKSYLLSTNYRCGGEIVERAATQINNNKVRIKKQIKPYNEDGVVKVCLTSSDLYTESKQIYNYIINLIHNEGVSPDDISVIARNNAHLSILNFLLFRSNLFCNLREDVKLTTTMLYKDTKTIIEMVQDDYNAVMIKGILWKIISFLGLKGASVISEIMTMTGQDLISSIRYGLHYYSFKYRGKFTDFKYKPNKEVDEKLQNSFNTVITNSQEDSLYHLYEILIQEDNIKKCKDLLSLYANACKFMYNTEDKERTLRAYLNYLNDLLDEGYEVALSYMNLLEQYERNEIQIEEPKITLTTAHSAKGKEWQYVILIADDNITFPSFDGMKSMLIKDRLMAFHDLDEERRLHYVAMTRAKKELLVVASKANPSVFLLEAYGADLGDRQIEQLALGMQPLDISVLRDATIINLPDTIDLKREKLH